MYPYGAAFHGKGFLSTALSLLVHHLNVSSRLLCAQLSVGSGALARLFDKLLVIDRSQLLLLLQRTASYLLFQDWEVTSLIVLAPSSAISLGFKTTYKEDSEQRTTVSIIIRHH